MRLPLLPTFLVGAAVAAMIALGVWQIGRAREKDELAARLRANRALPVIALPRGATVDPSLHYRRATGFCLEVVAWRRLGGASATGQSGTRFLAECRTGAEGPGFVADMGVSPDPKAAPRWRGGEVTGTIVPEPPTEPLLDRLLGRTAPPRPMLVSESAAPGLAPSRQPGLPDNSSWAYAVQWFFFAAAATLIYLLALRRRGRSAALPPRG